MDKFTEPMIATKRLRYATRMLTAGEAFLAQPKDVRLLVALKRAEPGRHVGKLDAPPEALRRKVASMADKTEAPPPVSADDPKPAKKAPARKAAKKAAKKAGVA